MTTRPAILVICAHALALLPATALQAEVFRYQDANGQWIFTDRPQGGDVYPADEPAGTTTGQPVSAPMGVSLDRDLATRLEQRFQPASAVEASSLAVIKVSSPIGSGSGFFVSENGLILTNRHVVKPPEDWAEERKAELERVKAQLDDLEQKLSLPRSRYQNPQAYDRGKQLLRERSLEYRQAKRELDMKGYAAQLQSSFEIELKDGTVLSADLVDISPHNDLALLQLKGYRTPFIVPMQSGALRQTDTVYAIGSPLGISDTVTMGTFTGTRGGLLVTDARVLPGNSGGPMVNQGGEAVGVNTLKATAGADPMDRGFGLAIPIQTAFEAFAALRR